MDFPKLTNSELIARLQPPSGKMRIVLDTDTYNEVDDQFAVAHALLSPEQMSVEALYAAPFHNGRSDGPADGMEKSYDEILLIYDLLEKNAAGKAFKGADRYLTSYDDPVISASVEDLIQRAKEYKDEPLYVAAIGCVTNIASALLLAPEIVKNIVVLWTAAYPTSVPYPNSSLNLDQDILGAQLLFDSGVPHVYLPGYHVGAQLTLSKPDMEAWIKDKGKIGAYLYEEMYAGNIWYAIKHISKSPDFRGFSTVIWDLINVAWLLNPSWVPTELLRAPRFGDDTYWHHDPDNRHWMREAYAIDRDSIFLDLIQKFEKAP